MKITLEKATEKDADALHAIKIKSFLPLLKKYNDQETNPACESLAKTLNRINDPLKGFYKILRDGTLVGGMAIKNTAPATLFLGPIFIDPDFQNQKIAQQALKIIEGFFPTIDFFELRTISQEKGNIYLYEKIGYTATGESKKINDSLDLLFYRKSLHKMDEESEN
jgi:RimJ/RimL family protein N-acetyltransferase